MLNYLYLRESLEFQMKVLLSLVYLLGGLLFDTIMGLDKWYYPFGFNHFYLFKYLVFLDEVFEVR